MSVPLIWGQGKKPTSKTIDRQHVTLPIFPQNKSVGYFEEEKEAAREYDKAVLELRGPGAQLNLPEEHRKRGPTREGVVKMPSNTQEEIYLAVETIVSAYESGSPYGHAERCRQTQTM